jgi:hypothetical protein
MGRTSTATTIKRRKIRAYRSREPYPWGTIACTGGYRESKRTGARYWFDPTDREWRKVESPRSS